MQHQFPFQPRLVETKSIIEIQSKYGYHSDKNLSIIINLVFLVILLIAIFFLYDRYNNKKQNSNENKIPYHQNYLI
jgi:uncharacterized membrane protein